MPADDGGLTVGGQRDGVALSGTSNRICADQLIGVLGPDSPAAAVDPRRPDVRVVFNAAHDGGAAVGGQRDGEALSGVSNRAGADQLGAPDSPAARVDPRRPSVQVVKRPAHDGGVAVGGQRNGGALSGVANRAGADQLVARLGPDTIAAGEDPRRPAVRVVGRPAHDGGVAVV